ncbi:MAG: hypothetical protein R2862_08605, partial [Thermoanaerobaculia bacterium]
HLEALNSGARVSATLEALLSTGARWNREANAVMSGASELLIGSALALLPPSNEATRGGAEGGNLVLALRAAYAIGIGGVLRRDYRLIGQLFHQAIWSPRRNRRIALVELLNPIDILDHDLLRAAYKPDPQRRYRFPHSEYLRATLRPSCSEICRDDARFARAFDTFEFLLGFSTYVLSGDRFWGPCGSWAIRAEYQDSVVAELSEEFRRDGVRWGPISEGLIPASEFESAWAQMESYVRFARNWAEKAAWG